MNRHKIFKKIYQITSQPLIRFISKRLHHDQQLVDEIFQETMLSAFKGLEKFENKSKYLTWLCRIAMNKIADYYRQNVNENSGLVAPLIDNLDGLFANDLLPEEAAILIDLRKNIRRCINLLPHEYRMLINLRYFKELSYKEIGKLLGFRARSVEAKLYRARSKLKELLLAEAVV